MSTSVIVFDVNETLSDLRPMRASFEAAGAAGVTADVWFAQVLRDGIALAAAGRNGAFADVAAGTARDLLRGQQGLRDLDAAADAVVAGLQKLPVHPDVAPGIHALAAAGHRLVTLSNGSVASAERLLTDAGIRDAFERLLSVEDCPAWKPSLAAYAYAVESCRSAATQMLLVAVHPWDINGAAEAGWRTAWLDRTGRPYPSYFRRPDITVASLEDLPVRLTGRVQ